MFPCFYFLPLEASLLGCAPNEENVLYSTNTYGFFFGARLPALGSISCCRNIFVQAQQNAQSLEGACCYDITLGVQPPELGSMGLASPVLLDLLININSSLSSLSLVSKAGTKSLSVECLSKGSRKD